MIESYAHAGLNVEIHADPYAESPREWDNLSTMAFFHTRYSLGDTDHGYRSEDFEGWDAMKARIMKDHKPAAIVPVYMFDHSGISISADTERFRAFDAHGWDWGQIGWAFVSREKTLSEYGGKNLTAKKIEKALQVLLGEIDTYNQFLQGDVYGYEISDPNDNDLELDAVWGFYGLDYAKQEANKAAEYEAKQKFIDSNCPHWDSILPCQKLSKNFLQKFRSNINWNYVEEYETKKDKACPHCKEICDNGLVICQHCGLNRKKPPGDITLAEHAEAWWTEQGNTVPNKETKEYDMMYEKWHTFAFKDFGKKGKKK